MWSAILRNKTSRHIRLENCLNVFIIGIIVQEINILHKLSMFKGNKGLPIVTPVSLEMQIE